MNRPKHIVNIDDLMNPKGNIKLCGHVCMVRGVHKDWICHQPATKKTGRCITHSPKDAFVVIPEPGDTYKRSSLMRELGLEKDFGDHRNDPEILEMKHELGLIDVRIDSILRLLKNDNSAANDKRLVDLLKVRRQYVADIYKTTSEGVPKERVIRFIYAMMNLTFKFITDPRQKAEYLAGVREISGRRMDDAPVPAGPDPIDMTPTTAESALPPETFDAAS